MNILRISKPENLRKMILKQSFQGLTKKIVFLLLIINSEFYDG